MAIIMTQGLSGGTVRDEVIGEAVLGVKDNSNKTFFTVSSYTGGTLRVNYNGQNLKLSQDFEEVGSNVFEFIYLKPHAEDSINVDYVLL